jgi:hypothetical protein
MYCHASSLLCSTEEVQLSNFTLWSPKSINAINKIPCLNRTWSGLLSKLGKVTVLRYISLWSSYLLYVCVVQWPFIFKYSGQKLYALCSLVQRVLYSTKVWCISVQPSERRVRVVNTPASCSGGPGLKFRHRDVSWLRFFVVSLSSSRQIPVYLNLGYDRFLHILFSSSYIAILLFCCM